MLLLALCPPPATLLWFRSSTVPGRGGGRSPTRYAGKIIGIGLSSDGWNLSTLSLDVHFLLGVDYWYLVPGSLLVNK